MTKGMRKDFQREIKLNFSRFLSITLIVVLGVAFFSGLRAAKPAMQASADKQYDSENLMDIRVAGTLGMTDKDVDALKRLTACRTRRAHTSRISSAIPATPRPLQR